MPSPARPRQRRALSAVGGAVTSAGDPAHTRRLAEALAAATGELGPARALPHGFHSYPARFHPRLVERLLDGVARGAALLDPFCGSGTTLIEGVRAGLRAHGSDVNPLAVALARLKATPTPADRRTRLLTAAGAVSERSLDRVKRRARTRTSGESYDDPAHYAPHIFRELVGLREEIDGVSDRWLRGALALVLSSIVVKVSRQPSDTAAGTVERAVGKGLPSRLFARKADELVRQLAALSDAVPPGTPRPDIRACDARALTHLEAATIDLIITSPPYVGTYDYAEQHARRFGWLDLDAREFQAREIGARRRTTGAVGGPVGGPVGGAVAAPVAALAAWQTDVNAFIAEMARVLRPDGRAYLVMGDSALGRHVVPGDAAVRQAAARAKLTVVASAAQERTSFYAPARAPTRREHLLMLRR